MSGKLKSSLCWIATGLTNGEQIPIHKTSILESGVAYETADGGETLLGLKDLASMLST
jgi:hypothetical protein